MFSSGGRPLREAPIRELEIGHPLMRTPQSQRRNGCILTFRDGASLRGSHGQAICSLAQIAAFPLPPHIHLSLLWQFISCVPIACGIHKQELSQKPRQDRKEGSDLATRTGCSLLSAEFRALFAGVVRLSPRYRPTDVSNMHRSMCFRERQRGEQTLLQGKLAGTGRSIPA